MRSIKSVIAAFSAALFLMPAAAFGQQLYSNLSNVPFRAVGSGPQSALVADVNNPNDRAAVRSAVDAKVHSALLEAEQGSAPEIAFLRQRHLMGAKEQAPLVEMVFTRHNGKILMPPASALNRAAGRGGGGGNTLTFVAATTGTYAFDVPTASALDNVMNNLLYTELLSRIGAPGWNGQVNVLNKDDNPTKVSGIVGVTVVINPDGSVDIDLPNFSTDQDKYLGLLQAMAQTFHGPLAIGYDAWEMGLARAEAVVAAQDLQGKFPTTQPIDPAASFYYTPYYDLLNQPALGNNTFLPPTKSAQNLAGLGGMLVPRLQMSSSAWLKCFIQNPSFFSNFNSAYYAAWQSDHTIANDSGRLSALAGQAVGGSVEGQPFATWFQQQYIFDTSVTPGAKEYLFATPTLPDSTHPEDGASVVVLYYQTTSAGDELDLSSVSNPIFYDYTYKATLTLSGAGQPVNIVSGEGYTQPYFTGLGTGQAAQMRLTMDFPVNSVSDRLPYPANESVDSSNNPHDFFGVVVGSDSGTLTASFSGGNGQTVTAPVANGAFGASGGAAIPDNFTQAKFSYQPTSGGAPIVYYRNVYQRHANAGGSGLSNVSSIFVFTAPTQVETLNHVFQAGPQMVSLPILPLNEDMAQVFGLPANQTLLAEWRQDAGGQNYLLYPSLPLYQPGNGFWTNFIGALNGSGTTPGIPITGIPTDNQTVINAGLEYGWNQIGTPFQTGLNVTSDPTTGSGGGVAFLYQGQTANLATAITNGWVATGVFGYDPKSASFQDVTATLPTGSSFLANTLEPWKGYFLLVKVSEGLTISYVNPTPNTRQAGFKLPGTPARRSAGIRMGSGWTLPLTLTDDSGRATAATLGEAPGGADNYVSQLDALSPPSFTGGNSLGILFAHPTWSSGRGVGSSYLSDIRAMGSASQWNITLSLPKGGTSYTFNWGATARLPRGVSLTLTDPETGTRMIMNGRSSYSFTAPQNETTRTLQINADPAGLRFAVISNLHINLVPTAGRAVGLAQVAFSVTGSAELDIMVRGPSGQVLRHLITGRAAAAGTNQAVWDLKDDQGRVLPSGVYVLEVDAHTQDGRQTRAIVPVTVIR